MDSECNVHDISQLKNDFIDAALLYCVDTNTWSQMENKWYICSHENKVKQIHTVCIMSHHCTKLSLIQKKAVAFLLNNDISWTKETLFQTQ